MNLWSNFCSKIVTLLQIRFPRLVGISKPLDIFRVQGTKFYRSPVSTAFFSDRAGMMTCRP